MQLSRRAYGGLWGLVLLLHIVYILANAIEGLWYYRAIQAVDGPYYELMTDIRETVEIATQINVAYRLSCFVHNAQVKHLAVSALLLNCWSTPVFRYLWRHDAERSRVLRIVAGILLAVIFTLVLPIAIFYLFRDAVIAPDSMQDPRLIVSVGNSLRQILIITWWDFISVRSAAVLAIMAMETIKHRVTVSPDTPAVAHTRVLAVGPSLTPPESKPTLLRRQRSAWLPPRVVSTFVAVRHRSPRPTNAIFWVVSLVIAFAHIA
ncbi:hypothetical protein P43SY_006918 [Pythium insidiosum]|uniref:Transmembrane protein n=1 Tax=Pythium insidiosum TaxID=114742 RepID=A0AAD5LLA5_PYTIN|nr:hypothetical protein P43SY_006918 [Pythium insidiosum]